MQQHNYLVDDGRSMRQRMLDGDDYIADDPDLAVANRRAIELSFRFEQTWPADPDAGNSILADLVGSLGADTEVRPPFRVDYGSYISIGARTFINYNLTALDVAPITIGDDVQIGPNVQLLTPTHPVAPGPRRAKVEGAKPITIGDNVWIGGGANTTPKPRQRRHDPDRRERLIDVALHVIAEHGVAGTSHRRVAAAAGVPLGSMTYHFAGMDELLEAAFTRLAEQTAHAFDQAMLQARTPEAAVEAIVGLITGDVLNRRESMVATYELYSLAARRPEIRTITNSWMARSRTALERHFTPDVTVMLDALIEGLTIHRALALDPMPDSTVRAAVKRISTA
jgi:DNA-binding transcriptional regulator YbjK/acetyltransferase-like isoleucine patch superfamily enzyme